MQPESGAVESTTEMLDKRPTVRDEPRSGGNVLSRVAWVRQTSLAIACPGSAMAYVTGRSSHGDKT